MSIADALRVFRSRPIESALLLLCVIAALIGMYGFLVELSRQLGGPLYLDAKIYAAVGRGLLNGLEPYSEIFESKPPLIFLIMALSLRITGDQRFASFLQILVLTGVPVSLVIFVLRHLKKVTIDLLRQWIILFTTLLFGLMLAQYSAHQAGYIQTESFGAFFAILYLLVLQNAGEHVSLRRMIVLSILIFFSACIKEPFILVMAGGALLLWRNARVFVRGFVIPAVIAGVLGILLLLALGSWNSYLELYLPYMSQSHTAMDGISPWERGLRVHRIIVDLFHFSPFLLGAVLVAFISTFAMRRMDKRELWWMLLRYIVAVYITSVTVALGVKYYPHHFIFALPLYVTMFVLMFQWWLEEEAFSDLSLHLTCVCSAVFLLLFPIPHPTWTKVFTGDPLEQQFHATAKQLDDLMDACKYDRYLAYGWELEELWSRTKHSPYGSSFTNFAWGLDRTVPVFTKLFIKRLKATPLIVIQDERIPQLDKETEGFYLPLFTEDPPPCAKPFVPLGEYSLLFRT